MMARETWTDDRMDDLAHRVDAGFRQVDRRFEQIESRFEGRFAQLHEDIRALQAQSKEAATRQELYEAVANLRSEMNVRFKAVEERFNTVDERFRGVGQRFDAVDKRLDRVDKGLDEIRDRIEKRFDMLQTTLIAAILTGIIGLIASHIG